MQAYCSSAEGRICPPLDSNQAILVKHKQVNAGLLSSTIAITQVLSL